MQVNRPIDLSAPVFLGQGMERKVNTMHLELTCSVCKHRSIFSSGTRFFIAKTWVEIMIVSIFVVAVVGRYGADCERTYLKYRQVHCIILVS